MDIGLRAISCSPSNLTGNGGCIAALLSSNMDLSLWHAAKNTIKGEWAKLCEATPLIIELISRGPHSKVEQTLRSQITCLLWSTHADFAITPSPCLDSSLIATGTRAGTLMLFRFKDSSLEHVTTVEVTTKWITHLAFSRWTLVKEGESELTLSCGAADGSVRLVKITQTLSSVPSASGFTLDYAIQTNVQKSDASVFQPSQTGITALSWIFPCESPVLVRATPGVISLWSDGSPTLRWSGHRSFNLCVQKTSVGSSSIQPVSGLHYAHHEDALFVSLFDGSIHVIKSLIDEPELSNTSQNSGDQTSEGVSDILRATFARAEKLKVSKRDVNRISGMIPYDDYSVAIWVQESAQPANFDYKYDVLHESTFIAARLCKPLTPEMILLELGTILTSAQASSGSTPIYILRPIFLHLKDLLELRPRVLGILVANADTFPPSPTLPSWSGEPDPQFRADFQKSLKQHLFGCNVLLSLRLRLSVAEFCWRQTSDLLAAEEYDNATRGFLTIISFVILRVLCRHVVAVGGCIQEGDLPFLMRIIVQASLPSAPADLRADAETLTNVLAANIPAFSRESFEKQAMQETCPACGLPVYLESGTEGVCSAGHSWSRCTVTTFLLSTPNVRTCVGCTRKAFLPLSSRSSASTSNWLPPPAQSWVVEELLEAVSRCLFCGNNFASIF
ncbi:putative zinc-finger of transcription factor IIIC complex-domain-containing protein [Mycena metata]|uniref:Zinc-finger of transcription factor IIIC complex-domain-containing protein n=1 Tax=Mycena metata TaxID=1033252 RepID=A0AAD7K337_9AGAR|nr:putative zinc-finger of transcription factor IIIC complex-domain-containing protein [Mycena metata]